jgi:hypothetical protein
VIGTPLLGESNIFQNAINSAQYEVTDIVNQPLLTEYGTILQGSIADPAQLNDGSGPLAVSRAAYLSSAGFAGTLGMVFDCQLATAGTDGASCFVLSELLSLATPTQAQISIAPQTVFLGLQGDGNARWDGNQISASGNDYNLQIGFSELSVGGTTVDTIIAVRQGVVVAVQHGTVPFDLPSIGSSGSFVISAPVQPISYDFRSLTEQDRTQSLILESVGSAFSETALVLPISDPAPVPELTSFMLVGMGLGLLRLGRSLVR